jgi:Dyp-type peroxidase family
MRNCPLGSNAYKAEVKTMKNRTFTIDAMKDTQGLVFSGYGSMPFCSYYLLQIKDSSKARPWLKQLADDRISPGEPDKAVRATKTSSLNLALSATGFEKLAVKKDTFEQAFQEGMHSPRRSTILGDQGDNHPDTWQWGNAKKPVDILLMLYSKDKKTHSKRQKEEETAFKEGGLAQVAKLDTSSLGETGRFEKEHFGFADGVSNPIVAGFPGSDKTQSPDNPQAPQVIATGEFILGYPNGYDGKETTKPEVAPLGEEFGVNGTYLVFRQLQQDVKGFWTFVTAEAKKQTIKPDYLAAKMVGRWKNGAIVQPGQTSSPETVGNDFDFSDDMDGTGCPYGSHIRRTNPRGQGLGVEQVAEQSVQTSLKVANRHRILRRGRSYGNFLEKPLEDDDSGERGLFFICLNANIERQFEFIQHTWVNNLKFNGLYNEDDPLIGTYGSSDENFKRSFTIQDEPLRRHICNFQQFVTLRGGGYFFLPGIKALRMLGG